MKATLKSQILKAIKSYNTARDQLHTVSCLCVEHALIHGDVEPLHFLLEEMGTRSQTRHRIAAWVRHHGHYEQDGKTKFFLNANINKEGKVSVKVASQDIRNNYTVQPFKDGPYWEVLDTQAVKAAFELDKAVLALVKKAEKEGCNGTDIKSSLERALKVVNG